MGVARSTAHRLLSMLSYRDFAVQDGDRRYSAGPVLSLAARTHSRAALLRAVAMPHLTVLTGRVAESTPTSWLLPATTCRSSARWRHPGPARGQP